MDSLITITSKKLRTDLGTYKTTFHVKFKSTLELLISNNDLICLKCKMCFVTLNFES